jgi:hypothetical protein
MAHGAKYIPGVGTRAPSVFEAHIPTLEGSRKMKTKRIALPLLFASVVAFAQAPDAGLFSGKWKVHSIVSGNEYDTECTFVQKDNDVTGTCTTDNGPAKLTGKVDGKKLSWSYESEYNGAPLTLKYSGTLDAGKIDGDIDVVQYNVGGGFTATQEK